MSRITVTLKTMKQIKAILENNNFHMCQKNVNFQNEKFYLEIGRTTPEGEDWRETICFDGTFESFTDYLKERANTFDVDDEVEPYIPCRGKHGCPSSIKALIAEAEWKKEVLLSLSKAFCHAAYGTEWEENSLAALCKKSTGIDVTEESEMNESIRKEADSVTMDDSLALAGKIWKEFYAVKEEYTEVDQNRIIKRLYSELEKGGEDISTLRETLKKIIADKTHRNQPEQDSYECMVEEYLSLFYPHHHIASRKENNFLIWNNSDLSSYTIEIKNDRMTTMWPSNYRELDCISNTASLRKASPDALADIQYFEDRWYKHFTTSDEIKSTVYEDYMSGGEELNINHFSIPVKATKATLLKTYADIQNSINGDTVVRLSNCTCANADLSFFPDIIITGTEEDIASCEDADEIFIGEYKDFLKSYNDMESETQLYRLRKATRDEKGIVSGIKLDFVL